MCFYCNISKISFKRIDTFLLLVVFNIEFTLFKESSTPNFLTNKSANIDHCELFVLLTSVIV